MKKFGKSLLFAGIAALMAAFSQTASADTTIDVQFRFSPSAFPGAPPGGAHPVGGLAQEFVTHANERSALTGVTFNAIVGPGSTRRCGQSSLHLAVALGIAGGGCDAGITIPINNGHSFGELFVAGLPFGMSPKEYITYLYEGGGLTLQQSLYDQAFSSNLVVIPIGITTAQGPGWFPQALPDPDSPGNKKGQAGGTSFDAPDNNDIKAMKELCETPMIVRWAEPGGLVWRKACDIAGAPATLMGAALGQFTRCTDAFSLCGTESNPVTFFPTGLTFGGFTPGIIPQRMLATGNIDAHEFNLPTADIQWDRLALSQLRGVPIGDVPLEDISEVIAKAPFQYAGAWHQPLSYIELVINRAIWDGLTDTQRLGIQTVARSAVLRNLTARLNLQGAAMAFLKERGAIQRRWPNGLLRVLRVATDMALDDKATSLDDPTAPFDEGAAYRAVLESQRAYIQAQKAYWDYGDINQGQNQTPTN